MAILHVTHQDIAPPPTGSCIIKYSKERRFELGINGIGLL